MVKNTSMNFETSLIELENIVITLETGNMPLDAALTAYQKGVALLRQCQQILAAVDQSIHLLEQSAQDQASPLLTERGENP